MVLPAESGSAPVFVVAARPALALVYAESLAAHGLPATAVEPAAVPSAEGWLVVLVSERWTTWAISTLEWLRAAGKQVAVLCPAAASPETSLTMLRQGATEAYPDDRTGREALAIKLRRRLGQHGVACWRLGLLIFDVDEARLLGARRSVDLTPTENRLLRRFCRFRLTAPAQGIQAGPLGDALEIEAGSVRNHITRLRRKIEEDPDHPKVLVHGETGYYLAPDETEPLSHAPGM